jgi:hypothetical protein
VPDTATACAALIEAHSGALRIIRQAVGAVPALGGLSVPLEVIERQLDVARKALSPPVE